MEERVSVIKAQDDGCPIILVAPHGAKGDDDLTAELTKKLADNLGCWAIINWGFERSEKVDYFADKANCNNIEHLNEDVVREEFLNPLQKAVNSVLNECFQADIFMIHGMSNSVRDVAEDNVDVVVGYGDSNLKKPSYTCDIQRKNAMIYACKKNCLHAYIGKAGGKYAAARKTNLTQLYRLWNYDENVHSMQLEIVKELRQADTLDGTVETFTNAFENYIDFLVSEDDMPEYFEEEWEEIGESVPSI